MRLLIIRALCLIASTYCFVAAIRVMPIADALAIAFIEPFIILVLGYLIFNEVVGVRRIGARIVGFIGALFVIQPRFAAFGFVALYPLGTAFSFAAYMIVTRRLSKEMRALPMQMHTATVSLLFCLPVLVVFKGSGFPDLDAVMPEGLAWLWLFGVGLFAAISHLMVTYALGMAPTSTLAPLHYFEIISAVALGYLVFSDFPNATTWIGIAIIVASGLYIIHRERQLSRLAAQPLAR
jgi:drug/metabolite transporter (DMT)-like permease